MITLLEKKNLIDLERGILLVDVSLLPNIVLCWKSDTLNTPHEYKIKRCSAQHIIKQEIDFFH